MFYIFNMVLGKASQWKNCQWPRKILNHPWISQNSLKENIFFILCLSQVPWSLLFCALFGFLCFISCWSLGGVFSGLWPPVPWMESARSPTALWSSPRVSLVFFGAVDCYLPEALCFLHFAHFPSVLLLPFSPFCLNLLPPSSGLVLYQSFPDSLLPLANFSNSFVSSTLLFCIYCPESFVEEKKILLASWRIYTPFPPPQTKQTILDLTQENILKLISGLWM